ncbi:MAG: class I SAM-dependent methyltransferase [Desulfobacterales bacterium]|nr:class I SAM-dependent methyltransferase [Desulfobacterales bacterium]
MEQDRKKWNEKYAVGQYPSAPSAIVKDFYSTGPVGRALDIAAGKGRNSLFLAERGFQVEALDISERALLGLETYRNVTPRRVDFDDFDIPENQYSLVLNVRFLHRRLFPQIMESLVPGGVLIFETYLMDEDAARDHEHRREHMLRPNELLRAFLPLRIIYYRETLSGNGEEDRAIASLVAIKK